MCEAVGHPVASLRRISFGNLRLGTLEEGKARRLSAAEVDKLRSAASGAVTATAVRSALGAAPSPGRRRSPAPRGPRR
jgi:hypothetical protein